MRRAVGAVREDKKRGTWYYVVDNGANPATGKRRRKQGNGFRTETAARKALKKFLTEQAGDDYVEPSSQRVSTYLERWLASAAVSKKASTAAMYAYKLRRYVIPRIGTMPLRAVDAAALDALYADLLERGGVKSKPLSEQTVAVVHRILHRAFADAARRRIIRSNPASDAVVPRSTAPRERDAWDADELRTFLASVRDDRLYALWLLAATTGMRRGELCGLKWSDVQLDGGTLIVRRSRVPVPGRCVVESTPKSDRTREIALAAATVTALRTHRKAQLEERLAWSASWNDTGYVFTNEDGGPVRPDAVTQSFNAAVNAAGLRPIVMHGLRHTHITLGLGAGVPVRTMQERAGHAKVETTLSYTHTLAGMQEQAAATVERLILGG
jgi:integrase